ncbi:hypothetical protein ElyMa_000414200 [Elysia marginata]|uniref:Uncharacterized protein n=1 Tax=Elysia marginata TaxID=1093978 RepID=A0AAV4FK98_9GAST|nr:hypothetical protein ElyMa_000414200 [Elysia marginata]
MQRHLNYLSETEKVARQQKKVQRQKERRMANWDMLKARANAGVTVSSVNPPPRATRAKVAVQEIIQVKVRLPGPVGQQRKEKKQKEKLCSPVGYKPATSLREAYDHRIDSTDDDFQRKGENC